MLARAEIYFSHCLIQFVEIFLKEKTSLMIVVYEIKTIIM